MHVIHGDGPRTQTGPSAVTIGAYDGVHVGHRAVIAEVTRIADERGLQTVVVTFDRHPAQVVRPESAPKLLCDLDQKLELLADSGVDTTYVIHFDEAQASVTAEHFVDDVLVSCLDARAVVVGADFHFGKGRGGNVEVLRGLGRVHGFTVEGLDLVDRDSRPSGDGQKVSSTVIRSLLSGGDVAEAAELLGRPHEVRGAVERGDGRGGQDLGFPTANLTLPSEIQLPSDGIYAGWLERTDGTIHKAAISLGHRPTFYDRPGDRPLLECHLIDFSGNLYGELVRVRFVERLRGEEKFDSVDALVAQIQSDVDRTKALLPDP